VALRPPLIEDDECLVARFSAAATQAEK
jgi:hypothetical protein